MSELITIEQHLDYKPHDYQLPLLNYLAQGGLRAVAVWHRRAGKDLTLLNAMILSAWFRRVGTYFYFYPTYSQGKKAIWDGMDNDSKPFLSYIPASMIASSNETEMQVKLKNGSILQIVGTDRYDSVRSTNPVGCVFSEYQDQDPEAFNVVEPVLKANKGWAAFAYTPRGRNHGWDLSNFAANEASWFHQILTIEDTKDKAGLPIIDKSELDELRRRGVSDEFILQEYYCSFKAALQGSYYGSLLASLYTQHRVAPVAYAPGFPVYTGWDIGVGDQTAIWFAQVRGDDIHLIDYYENSGEGFDHYLKIVLEKPYTYDTMYMPHDVAKTEWGTGKSMEEVVVKAFRLRNISVSVIPRLSVDEGILAVRRMFPRLRIDKERCGDVKYRGHGALDCLNSYHKKWDSKRMEFADQPNHDWSSHCADALRYLALGLKDTKPTRVQTHYQTQFDPMQDVRHDQYNDEYTYLDEQPGEGFSGYGL